MKNILKNVGVSLFGLCVAIGLSPSNVTASEDDLIIDVNVESLEVSKSSVLDVNMPIIGAVNANSTSGLEVASDASATVNGGVSDGLDLSVQEETDVTTGTTVELESPLTNEVEVDFASEGNAAVEVSGGVLGGLDLSIPEQTDVLPKATAAVEELKSTLTNEVEVGFASEGNAAVEVSGGVLGGLDLSVPDQTDVLPKATAAVEELKSTLTNEVEVDFASDGNATVEVSGGVLGGLDLSVPEQTDVLPKATAAVEELKSTITNEVEVGLASEGNAAVEVSGGISGGQGLSVQEQTDALTKAATAVADAKSSLADEVEVDIASEGSASVEGNVTVEVSGSISGGQGLSVQEQTDALTKAATAVADAKSSLADEMEIDIASEGSAAVEGDVSNGLDLSVQEQTDVTPDTAIGMESSLTEKVEVATVSEGNATVEGNVSNGLELSVQEQTDVTADTAIEGESSMTS